MQRFLVSAAVFVIAITVQARAGAINEWNLMVRHNLTTTSEVDGSALIGGNISGTSNYAVHGATALNGDGLAVGGNITNGINVQLNDGNLRIAGSVLGNVNYNGGGSQINDAGVPAMVASAFAEIEALSAYFSTLPSNGTIDPSSGNMNAVPTLIDGQNVAVYTVTPAFLTGTPGQLNLNFGSADTVIINVVADGSGVVDLIAPPNLIGGFSQTNSNRILWNMPDATQILVNNTFNGALLAPLADLKLQGGGMNGSIAVNSFSQMNAEVRSKVYTGFTPEPGTLALLTLGGMFALRRKR